MAHDDAGRQQRYRERNTRGGLVEVKVIVPAARADELRAFAAALRTAAASRAARQLGRDPGQADFLAQLDCPSRREG